MERWSRDPAALARVGANAARRGLAVLEALAELDRSIATRAAPQRLDRLAVAHEVINGWIDVRRAIADPASGPGGLASSAYLRARVHDAYRSAGGALVHGAVVIARSRTSEPTPWPPAASSLDDARPLAGITVAEHGPNTRVAFSDRRQVVEIARLLRVWSPHDRVWIEALPARRQHVDRWLQEIRGAGPAAFSANVRPHRAGDGSADVGRRIRRARALANLQRPVDAGSRWAHHDRQAGAALVERLHEGREFGAALHEYGDRRRRSGATWFEVLGELGVLIDSMGPDALPLDRVETAIRVGAAWTVGDLDDETVATVIDAVTGLPGRHYLQRRVREVIDAGHGGRLVTIELPVQDGVEGLGARLRVAQSLRWWFRDADTLATPTPTKFAVLLARGDASVLDRQWDTIMRGVTVRVVGLADGDAAMGA